jgi:hypothetical protein
VGSNPTADSMGLRNWWRKRRKKKELKKNIQLAEETLSILEEKCQKREEELRLLGITKQKALMEEDGLRKPKVFDETHLFVVETRPGSGKVVGVNARNKEDALDKLGNNLTATQQVSSYIGEVNEMLGT